MYCVQAVVATPEVLRGLVGADESSDIVPLGQRWSLLPMAFTLAWR